MLLFSARLNKWQIPYFTLEKIEEMSSIFLWIFWGEVMSFHLSRVFDLGDPPLCLPKFRLIVSGGIPSAG